MFLRPMPKIQVQPDSGEGGGQELCIRTNLTVDSAAIIPVFALRTETLCDFALVIPNIEISCSPKCPEEICLDSIIWGLGMHF